MYNYRHSSSFCKGIAIRNRVSTHALRTLVSRANPQTMPKRDRRIGNAQPRSPDGTIPEVYTLSRHLTWVKHYRAFQKLGSTVVALLRCVKQLAASQPKPWVEPLQARDPASPILYDRYAIVPGPGITPPARVWSIFRFEMRRIPCRRSL
jgi:hypothetical protein